MSDTTNEAPESVTYGGVQDRLDDVNHPDNATVEATPEVTPDAAAPSPTAPEGYYYNPVTDSYVRNGQ